jgi:hypothetical protein
MKGTQASASVPCKRIWRAPQPSAIGFASSNSQRPEERAGTITETTSDANGWAAAANVRRPSHRLHEIPVQKSKRSEWYFIPVQNE